MNSRWIELLKCPLCGAATERVENSLFCTGARRHCFDFSSAGYVNLAPAKAAGGGDDATLIRARSAFLSAGHYAPLSQTVSSLLCRYAPGGMVVDAGCGEGYYTVEMAKAGLLPIGFDLSKNGIKHAAKAARALSAEALFAVSGIFDLPLADQSADAVVSLFAPVAEEEFLRVLKPGGVLLLAGAGPMHLFSLKSVLYETPYCNQPRADLPQKMNLLESELLRFDMELGQEALQALFAMTPYFYRTPRSGKERLDAKESLTVGAEVELSVWQKPV